MNVYSTFSLTNLLFNLSSLSMAFLHFLLSFQNKEFISSLLSFQMIGAYIDSLNLESKILSMVEEFQGLKRKQKLSIDGSI